MEAPCVEVSLAQPRRAVEHLRQRHQPGPVEREHAAGEIDGAELSPGELAARAFECFEQRYSLAEVVITLRVEPKVVRELFHEWPYLLTLGISVSINCYWSTNHLFIPGYVLGLISRAPTTATA